MLCSRYIIFTQLVYVNIMDIFKFLEDLDVSYQKFDHAAVYTCDEANSLNPDITGARTKNLFLRDRKGQRHFLVVASDGKSIDFKELSESLDVKQLSFGSTERLKKYLQTTAGSVSILDIVNDPNNLVELVIDQAIWDSSTLQCHPLINTSTLVIELDDIKKIFEHLDRVVKVITI